MNPADSTIAPITTPSMNWVRSSGSYTSVMNGPIRVVITAMRIAMCRLVPSRSCPVP